MIRAVRASAARDRDYDGTRKVWGRVGAGIHGCSRRHDTLNGTRLARNPRRLARPRNSCRIRRRRAARGAARVHFRANIFRTGETPLQTAPEPTRAPRARRLRPAALALLALPLPACSPAGTSRVDTNVDVATPTPAPAAAATPAPAGVVKAADKGDFRVAPREPDAGMTAEERKDYEEELKS